MVFTAGIRVLVGDGDFFEIAPACILPRFRDFISPGFIRRQSSF